LSIRTGMRGCVSLIVSISDPKTKVLEDLQIFRR